MSESDFVSEMTPYAQQASAATGIDPSVILAQWGNETGWGTSQAWTQQNNPAGIGWNGNTYYSYGSIAEGVQGWIDNINNNPQWYGAVKSAQGAQAQAIALGNSPWAGGHYDAGSGPGSALLEIMQGMGGTSTMTADASTTAAVSAAGGSTNPNGTLSTLSQADQNYYQQFGVTQESAWQTVQTNLQQYGFSPTDAAALAQWAQGEITNNKSPEQVALDMYSTPQFQARFPAIFERQQKGLPAISPADYVSYEQNANALAQQVGLPQGFMTSQEIATLIGNDVSPTELQDRLVQGFQAANNADQETKDLLSSYFGINQGGLAAYYLDPTKALPLLENQITAAQIGTQGVYSGFGTLTPAQAMSLAQQGVSQSQATSTFKQIAPLNVLEQGLPGQQLPTVDQNSLLQYGFNGANQTQVQHAEQARTAPFQGGGGFASTNTGATGVGFGQQ